MEYWSAIKNLAVWTWWILFLGVHECSRYTCCTPVQFILHGNRPFQSNGNLSCILRTTILPNLLTKLIFPRHPVVPLEFKCIVIFVFYQRLKRDSYIDVRNLCIVHLSWKWNQNWGEGRGGPGVLYILSLVGTEPRYFAISPINMNEENHRNRNY